VADWEAVWLADADEPELEVEVEVDEDVDLEVGTAAGVGRVIARYTADGAVGASIAVARRVRVAETLSHCNQRTDVVPRS